MRTSKRKICQVLALVVSGMGTSLAMAAGPMIQGGGSSLVAPMIGSAGNPVTEIGLFGTANGTFTYYPVDAGAGQYAFFNNQPTFLGPGVTGTVHFAISDATLTTNQVTSYNYTGRGQTDGSLIQMPYVVTPITIPVVNAPAVTSTTTPQTMPGQAHSIALNDNDLCGIFSGKLTNWNQVTNPETLWSYPLNAPIKVIYQANASGATELLTRHLAAVCTTANTKSGVTFYDSLTFASTWAFPNGVPSNFVGANGSGGVRSALSSSMTAAVAYLSPAYTNTFLAPSSSVVTTAGALQLPVASLVNAKNGAYYAPTYANATTALGTVTPPSGASAFDPTQWVPYVGNPSAGYPVSGTSQIILSQCYANPAVATAVHDFLNLHYTNAAFASIAHANGFDIVPSNFRSAIFSNFLSNTTGNGLDIGNTSICGLYPGR
ncbi:substrate-binding domain-containing protein [Burkholderia stagnalis]|uniref:substrate-binding domain-containing protein n=1 Tax=Burkholderia stagnalis TaxID=1503054 RepID=UPI000752C692|nr:substrate-binding domain-containing protein [Burkholderia stagnalis]KVO54043.1 phosphate ABC transporter substrate-binding protein [Burkholderia stagnalis]KVP07886.1 phosphate ABC transporter substrate-binding protein [Burkholderia stagnalis]KVW89783.1 phosphate ABC transporter substrate-binding protein [Burkholderia stagnalis]KWH67048.1 phosphate ABC transporter substrate-binding protein [Burkholderia stagnalis]